MASLVSVPVRSRSGLKLSSIHVGRRKYPKVPSLDLQPCDSPPENKPGLLSPSSSTDTLPGHTMPTSPKPHHRSHGSFHSITSIFAARDGIRIPRSRTFWILLWFSLNFSLTLSNKVVLNRFPFPYTVSGVHALCCCIGTWFVLRPEERLPTLSSNEIAVLVSFSLLYTLNIVVSNVSLQLVTIPFHQVVRSSAPFFTLILSRILLHSRITKMKVISLMPVVVGVVLATYGDYYYTLSGFLLTLLGTFLASLKTVITNILQTPDSASSSSHIRRHDDTPPSYSQSLSELPKILNSNNYDGRFPSISITVSLPPDQEDKSRPLASLLSSLPKLRLTSIQLLHLLSPLALAQCIILAIHFNEHTKLFSYLSKSIMNELNVTGSVAGIAAGMDPNADSTTAKSGDFVFGSILPIIVVLAPNAFMAFALNIVSFETNRRVGALGISVAANVKQVLTILSSVGLFHLTITRMNALGILLTLIGGGWYASVDLRDRRFHR